MNKHIYTEEQLDAMSDLDITIACANKLGYPVTDINSYGVIVFNGVDQVIFNPLESYNDCMPIADKYCIDILNQYDGTYIATEDAMYMIGCTDSPCCQPTMQRAIVYCYLMMEID